MNAFVLDTNIIFSALLKNSAPRKIILSDIFDLYAPEFLFTEIKKYEEIILKKTGLSKTNFNLLLLLIQSHIAVIPFEEFSDFLKDAENIMVDIDIKDSPFLALALKLNISIWSNDNHLKEQTRVETYATAEIISNFMKEFDKEKAGIL